MLIQITIIYCSRHRDGLRARWPGLESQQKQELSFLHNVYTGFGAHLASSLMGTIAISPDVKWPGLETDLKIFRGQEMLRYTSTPPRIFTA
jgi:hypothetical protein